MRRFPSAAYLVLTEVGNTTIVPKMQRFRLPWQGEPLHMANAFHVQGQLTLLVCQEKNWKVLKTWARLL